MAGSVLVPVMTVVTPPVPVATEPVVQRHLSRGQKSNHIEVSIEVRHPDLALNPGRRLGQRSDLLTIHPALCKRLVERSLGCHILPPSRPRLCSHCAEALLDSAPLVGREPERLGEIKDVAGTGVAV